MLDIDYLASVQSLIKPVFFKTASSASWTERKLGGGAWPVGNLFRHMLLTCTGGSAGSGTAAIQRPAREHQACSPRPQSLGHQAARAQAPPYTRGGGERPCAMAAQPGTEAERRKNVQESIERVLFKVGAPAPPGRRAGPSLPAFTPCAPAAPPDQRTGGNSGRVQRPERPAARQDVSAATAACRRCLPPPGTCTDRLPACSACLPHAATSTWLSWAAWRRRGATWWSAGSPWSLR